MANHQSAKKRARQSEKLKVHNKYFARTARNMIKILRGATDKTEATEMLPKVTSILDKLSKKNIIHANKAANLKSSLTVQVNKL
ncbi:MAG: 30S ribosomal protein S20 [Bacteroidales bacterium]|nr:30S ribosomal protein S20 [Bacteroidales bacterium]